VSASRFTPAQRRVLVFMTVAVIVVFAMFAGFVVTYMQSLEAQPSVPTLALASRVPTPTSLPSPTAPPVSEEGLLPQVQAARLFEQIAHQVETLRGLSPRAEVPLSFLNECEMTRLLLQLYTERNLKAQLLPYTTLGLLPDEPIYVRPRQVAGLYVPEQGQLYVAIGAQGGDPDYQALLARAYTHALQDQQFDLSAMDDRATTTDALLAVRALVEGDALLSMALYRYQDLASADWTHLTELIQSEMPGYSEELDRSEAWARLQHFPYLEGRQFAQTLFQAGGWEAISRAYTAPPRSTVQVLHPERYLAGGDGPSTVVVPDLTEELGEGWTRLLRDTMGEFVVGLYLDAWLPEQMAWRAADGWDGDTFVAWEHEDGRRVLVWRTIWKDTAEATEFERALAMLVPERYLPARSLDPPAGMTGRWWETEAGALYVDCVGRYVTFVQAPDYDTLANLTGVLP